MRQFLVLVSLHVWHRLGLVQLISDTSSRSGSSNSVLSDLYLQPTTNLLPFRDVVVEGSSYALNEEVMGSSLLFPIAYADDDTVGPISRSRHGARTAHFDARVDGMRRAVSAMDPLQVLQYGVISTNAWQYRCPRTQPKTIHLQLTGDERCVRHVVRRLGLPWLRWRGLLQCFQLVHRPSGEAEERCLSVLLCCESLLIIVCFALH